MGWLRVCVVADQTFEFQTDARQLLQLMIHSIYSSKDVFLRELISNASDALDKLRLESLRDEALRGQAIDLRIELLADAGNRTLTVRDNGIGMTRDEVVGLIGTIARSGTDELLTALRATRDAGTGIEGGDDGRDEAVGELIGKFGIGFYSGFMVANRMTLVTRRAGAETGVRWESDGQGTYTVADEPEAPRGTTVTLHLAPADDDDSHGDYTDPAELRRIVTRYSDFITWPVLLVSPAESVGSDESTTPGRLNSGTPLWSRPKSEVDEAEYTAFYRRLSHDWQAPLETIRLRAEGTFEYQALLFLPAAAPPDLYVREHRGGLQLYVRRVFIMDDCAALLPNYLRFVRGVVDAADLSLNVSREILQQDRQIQAIRRRLVKKVLGTLATLLADEPEKYAALWRELGPAIKEGLLEDPDNRERILELCSFPSTHDPEAPTTLRAYRERMPTEQKQLLYMTGDSRSAVENSPHLEAPRARGHEVLLLTDPIDELWLEQVTEFDGLPLTSIAQGLDEPAEDTSHEERDTSFAGLLGWLGTLLDEEITQARLTTRLTSSPACLVSERNGMTPHLERLYRAAGQEVPKGRRILELNPEHPLVTGLRAAHEQRPDDETLPGTARLLHDMALLAEGGDLPDPARFVSLLAVRLTAALPGSD